MIRAFDRKASHRPSRPTILISAVVACGVLLGLTYLAAVAPRGIPGLPYYYVNAQFRNSSNINILSTVQIAGRRVGQVSDITYDNGLADLKLQLLPGTQTLRSGSTARIRVKNPIGAKYVEITPSNNGTALASGDTIPVSHTSTAIDTQGVFSTFDAPTRKNLQLALIGLGKGFLGRGTGINEVLGEATPELENFNLLSEAVLAQPGAAARFAPSAESLAAAYDPVRGDLASGFRPQANVLQDFADEQTNVQQTLDVAPGSLSALRAGLAEAQPLLEQTAGFARASISLTQPAPAALQAATSLLREGVPSLERAEPLLQAIDNAVPPTTSLLEQVDPVISPTERALHNQLRPLINLAGRQCDFLTQGADWRSALSWGIPANSDPLSTLSDGETGLGPNINSFRVLAVPESTTESLLPDAPGDVETGTDAYPAPCVAPSERLP